MAERKAVIKNADMSEDMQQDAVDCASQALEKYNIEKARKISPNPSRELFSRTRRAPRGSHPPPPPHSRVAPHHRQRLRIRAPTVHLSPPPTMRRPSAHPYALEPHTPPAPRPSHSGGRTTGPRSALLPRARGGRRNACPRLSPHASGRVNDPHLIRRSLGRAQDIAAFIKKEFDKKYNPTWHCIVGRNFGSYVTHETKHFIYFYLGQVAILLFKSG